MWLRAALAKKECVPVAGGEACKVAKHFLEGWLSKPGKTGLSRGDLESIGRFTAHLDKLQKGLGASACEHVVKGDNDSVLLHIAQLPVIPHARRSIRALMGYEQDAAAQRTFLALEGWDADLVRRLGGVLAAIASSNGYATHFPGSSGSPGFFRALAHLTAGCLGRLSPGHRSAPGTWLLNGARCLELLSLEGADQAALVDVLFAQELTRHWGGDGQRRLLSMNGLAEALTQAPARMLFGARALNVRGRCAFIEYVGRAALSGQQELLDFLFEAIVQGGKQEAEAALASLTATDPARVTDRAAQLLASADSDERRAAVRALLNTGTPQARLLLEERAAHEKSARVREQIEAALRSLRALVQPPPSAPQADGQGYVSIDGDWIAIPAAAPLPPDTPPPGVLKGELRAAVNEANAAARRAFEELQRQRALLSPEEQKLHHGPREFAELYSAAALGEFLDVVAGKLDARKASQPARSLMGHHASWYYRSAGGEYRTKLAALLAHPEITLHHLVRLFVLELASSQHWAIPLLAQGTAAKRLRKFTEVGSDFRTVLQAFASFDYGAPGFVSELLRQRWALLAPPAHLWPTVAEQLALIDQALGLAPVPRGDPYDSLRALELLSLLPAPPRRYLHVLLELAVGGAREQKLLARAMLASARSVRELIIPLLQSGEQSRRIAAAQWLRERRDLGAIPQLRAALAREKTDVARAVLLSALAALGEDISDQFSEERLLKDARTGLAKTRTRVERCMPLDHLPALAWSDGHPVAAEVARWWVVLADKLKNPMGDPLLNLSIDRLEPRCAEQLGVLALSSFVAFDTRRPGEEEANAHAEANADQLLQTYKKWRPNFTREQAFAQLKFQKLAEYLGSAIDHRGILALTRRAPGLEALNIVKAYFRDHYRRTVQCKALLEALANNPSPAALQFLLDISARYRSAGIRGRAAALVNAIAEERGWSREELADRTVPTGGLDERGVLKLPSGERTYVASLEGSFKVVLKNPAGQIVQALSGSGETAVAAKKALGALRKEVQQTVPQQTARLYEAMCTGRVWAARDIDAFLFRHPIVGRLCPRLLFAGLNAAGELRQVFRPLGDGSLSSAADEAVEITALAGVRIAHRLLLDQQQAAAWQQHLEDYEVSPLFEQLALPVLRPDAGQGQVSSIKEREGYMLDTFTLRAAASKLGYQRGAAQDGAWFSTYQKPFTSVSLAAVIDFTGSSMAETNVPCALLGLRFVRHGGASHEALPLAQVPPVLLSETWNDLRTVAAAGSGFDPQWQKKMRW